MAWTSAENVINRWTGTDDVPDATDVTLLTLIDDAEISFINRKFPTVQARIDNETLNIKTVQMVVSNMVQRAYQTRHDNKTAYSYGNGPFSESGSFASAGKGLYLTAEEEELLEDLSKTSEAFSINLDRGSANYYSDEDVRGVYAPNVWLPATTVYKGHDEY